MNVSDNMIRRWVARNPGAIVVASFCALVAGVNVPNAIVPISSQHYGFGPSIQSALFSLYLAALVAGLVIIPRMVKSGAPTAWKLLLAGAGIMLLADTAVALSQWALAALFIARILGGISLALGTGGAASLALAVAGEPARAAVGVGAVAGSLAGNAGGALIADLVPAPVLVVPAVHGVIVVLLGILLALVQVKQPASGATKAGPEVRVDYETRHRIAGYIVGAMSWTVAGMVLALGPGAVRGLSTHASLFTASAPAVILLAVAFLAQNLTRKHMLALRAWMVGIPMVAGLLFFAVALHEGSIAGLVFAGALIGLGQGPAYNLGLLTVTHRLPSVTQGKVASRYAATAYAACGVVVLCAGAAAQILGTSDAFIAVGLLLAVGAAASVVLAGSRQEISVA